MEAARGVGSEAAASSAPARVGSAGRAVAAGIAIALVLAGLIAAGMVSWGRSYQVDEVEHVHATYNLRAGKVLYRDFWEGHNPLLYTLLYPVVVPHDPEPSFRAARAVLAAVWIGTVVASAAVAQRFGGRRAAALAAVLLVMHTTFVERGLEVRPDGLLAALAMAALALEVGGGPTRLRRAGVGLLLGLAFLATQKAVFFCIAFGLVWLVGAWRRRRISELVVPCVAWTFPVALGALAIHAAGAWESYLEFNVLAAAHHVSREGSAAFSPWSFLVRESSRNVAFVGLVAIGLPWTLTTGARRRSTGPLVVAWVACVAVLSLWLNPFPFPYLHVSVLPPLAIAAALGAAAATRRLGLSGVTALAVVAALAGATSLPRLVEKAVPSNRDQLAAMATLHAVTGADEPAFDLVGLYFRPDAYPVFVMTGVMMDRYKGGAFPRMIPAWRQSGLSAVMANYRTGWLPEEEARFLGERFVHFDRNVFVPGRLLPGLGQGLSDFEVLRTATFRFAGRGELLVNGRPFTSGVLSAGVHRLAAGASPPVGRLARDLPFPARPIPPAPLYTNFD